MHIDRFDRLVIDVPSVELVERGPSTENIDQDSFGSRCAEDMSNKVGNRVGNSSL